MSDALLRRSEVERRVGMRKSTLYAKIAAGQFPRPVHRGASALWIESEIDGYVETLKRQRDAANDSGLGCSELQHGAAGLQLVK